MLLFLQFLNPFTLQSFGHVPANMVYKRCSALHDSRDCLLEFLGTMVATSNSVSGFVNVVLYGLYNILKPSIGRLLSAHALFFAHCRFGGRAGYHAMLIRPRRSLWHGQRRAPSKRWGSLRQTPVGSIAGAVAVVDGSTDLVVEVEDG